MWGHKTVKIRQSIINHICYTDLVYDRINKKLKTDMDKEEIEKFILNIVTCKFNFIQKIGKNYYLRDKQKGLSITINSSTYRVITVDKL